jgi:glycosyltransferase involved in cell wall biosynthesis
MTAKERIFSLLYENINRKREKQISRHADQVAFQNSIDRDAFTGRTGYPESRTVLIPGNIGLPRFTDEWKNKNTSGRVQKLVYVGGLSESKGYSSLKLFALGKADGGEKVIRLADSLGLKEMIFYEGYALPFPYLASCDLMVYPTLYDAFPDTVLEALHTGCPVIASTVGGIPDMLKYPELLFESGNSAEIADRIERCIKDSDFYLSVRNLCAERAETFRFDWATEWEKAMSKFQS